jgi:hypothetical protein
MALEYSSDMSVVSEPGVLETLSPLLEEAKTRAVEIRSGDELLGAIVSKDDYEIVRKAKVDRLMASMDELGSALRKGAAAEGISLDELEKMLDRKAP